MMLLKTKLLSSSLLLLALASFGDSEETCPEDELVYPCFCAYKYFTGDLVLKCFPYKEDVDLAKLRQILSTLSGKKKVEVLLNQCPWTGDNFTIPSDLFSGIGVQHLKFEYCKINGLTSDNQPPLLGLENDLEILQIIRSLTSKAETFVLNLGHLQKLKELYIFENKLKALGNGWIDAPASLERFSMRKNGVKRVGDRAFADLVHVKEFYFADDSLTSLRRSMFPDPAPKLQTLYLSNNGIKTLPEDIFSNMPALRSVDFYINYLSTLDQSTWQPVWRQLDSIGLIANSIRCDNSLDWILSMGKLPRISGGCRDRKNKWGRDMDISEYLKSQSQE